MTSLRTIFLTALLVLAPAYLSAAEDSSSPPKIAPVSEDGVQRLDVIVDSYSYTPAHIQVTAAKPVELNLRSVTSVVPHNFVIDDPASGIEIRESVPSGKDVTVSFTPTNTGTFKFYCSKSGIFGSHLEKGMEGTITVVQ